MAGLTDARRHDVNLARAQIQALQNVCDGLTAEIRVWQESNTRLARQEKDLQLRLYDLGVVVDYNGDTDDLFSEVIADI